MFGLSAGLLSAGCGATEAPEATATVQQRATSSSSSAPLAPCTIGTLSSTRPGKSTTCPPAKASAFKVSQQTLDKQRAYLEAWQAKKNGAWKALSDDQQEEERRKLKASIYAGVTK